MRDSEGRRRIEKTIHWLLYSEDGVSVPRYTEDPQRLAMALGRAEARIGHRLHERDALEGATCVVVLATDLHGGGTAGHGTTFVEARADALATLLTAASRT